MATAATTQEVQIRLEADGFDTKILL